MKYEMIGTVTEVLPTQQVGSKGFSKREFRVREQSDSKWPNIVPFILTKEKCASIGDSLSEGAEVKVHFSLSGRIWDKGDGQPTRCFCENQCWKVDIISSGKPSPRKQSVAQQDDFGDGEDLPF